MLQVQGSKEIHQLEKVRSYKMYTRSFRDIYDQNHIKHYSNRLSTMASRDQSSTHKYYKAEIFCIYKFLKNINLTKHKMWHFTISYEWSHSGHTGKWVGQILFMWLLILPYLLSNIVVNQCLCKLLTLNSALGLVIYSENITFCFTHDPKWLQSLGCTARIPGKLILTFQQNCTRSR